MIPAGLLPRVLDAFPTPTLLVLRRSDKKLRLVAAPGHLASRVGSNDLLRDEIAGAIEGSVSIASESGSARSFSVPDAEKWPMDLARIGFVTPLGDSYYLVSFGEGSATDSSELHRFWDSVTDHIPGMLMIKDASELRIQVVSRSWERSFGISVDNMRGKTERELLPAAKAEAHLAEDMRALSEHRVFEVPEESFDAPVGARTLRTQRVAIRDSDGTPTHVLVLAEDITERIQQSRELERRVALIEKQHRQIQKLSAPVIQIWEGILAVPVAGAVDPERGMDIAERVLTTISATQARWLIVDITGVDVFDTGTAEQLLKIARATRLMGTQTMLSGSSPAIAQTMVHLGISLEELMTTRNLQDALRYCLLDAKDRADKKKERDPDTDSDLDDFPAASIEAAPL